ncbi:MAG: hypothetical protein ACJA2S_000012 [Cyclobacteriaceae bacterium]|jgi:hypothetical protein
MFDLVVHIITQSIIHTNIFLGWYYQVSGFNGLDGLSEFLQV